MKIFISFCNNFKTIVLSIALRMMRWSVWYWKAWYWNTLIFFLSPCKYQNLNFFCTPLIFRKFVTEFYNLNKLLPATFAVFFWRVGAEMFSPNSDKELLHWRIFLISLFYCLAIVVKVCISKADNLFITYLAIALSEKYLKYFPEKLMSQDFSHV